MDETELERKRAEAKKQILELLRDAHRAIPGWTLRGDGQFVTSRDESINPFEILQGMHKGRALIERAEFLLKVLP